MKVAKWGNSWAIRLPAAVVKALKLKEGELFTRSYQRSEARSRSGAARTRRSDRSAGSERVVAVARRKLRMDWNEVSTALSALRVLCPSPVPPTIRTHEAALKIAQRYGFGIFDALIVAAAMEARCGTLYSEDMQDGQVMDGLAIRNPFMR